MLSIITASYASSGKDYTSLFAAWKLKHGKSYETAGSESSAFTKFALNEDIITSSNAKQLSYTLGHNTFSDMTADEFFSSKLGYNAAATRQDTYSKKPLHVYKGEALPAAMDWVTKGAVTPIKNQGHCGSCWAFSAVGSTEGALFVASGKLTSLSEEDLVQCDTVDHGCGGGLMDNAFKFIETNGLASEAAYPYSSGGGAGGTCNKTLEGNPVVTVTDFTDVKSGDEDALRSAVAQQPVSIAIEADKMTFQLYRSGILDSTSCGKKLDHGVLLVGYGADQGKDYWKVKNSWGETWGEDGYIRMVRGKDQCGIATQPSYPTGVKAETRTKLFASWK